MNKVFLIIGIFIAVLLVIALAIGFFFWFAFGGGVLFTSNPPKPEITYGEFPISIIYEVDGKIAAVEDTVVCEFDGFETLGEAGKYRKWKTYLKSGNVRFALLRVEDADLTFEISAYYGISDYYMGDYTWQSKEAYETMMTTDSYLGYIQWENGVQTGSTITKEEVWEKCKLKILDVQFSLPIENTFE